MEQKFQLNFLQKNYNWASGLKLPVQPMLRLLEKIVQFQLLQDIPTSKMYLTGTDPTVFQNLRKSIIVKFLQNSNRPNAQEIDHSSSWTCNSNNLYYWRSCTDWIPKACIVENLRSQPCTWFNCDPIRSRKSSTAKIGHRCSCDRRKQNAREENHLIETTKSKHMHPVSPRLLDSP